MATGLRLGAEDRAGASLQAVGPGSCLGTRRGAGGRGEAFQSPHMAWGRAAGTRDVEDAACLAQASKPASLWHSVFPPNRQLLSNTPSLGSTFHTVGEAAVLSAPLPALGQPGQLH